jgi:hypothetical protein
MPAARRLPDCSRQILDASGAPGKLFQGALSVTKFDEKWACSIPFRMYLRC